MQIANLQKKLDEPVKKAAKTFEKGMVSATKTFSKVWDKWNSDSAKKFRSNMTKTAMAAAGVLGTVIYLLNRQWQSVEQQFNETLQTADRIGTNAAYGGVSNVRQKNLVNVFKTRGITEDVINRDMDRFLELQEKAKTGEDNTLAQFTHINNPQDLYEQVLRSVMTLPEKERAAKMLQLVGRRGAQPYREIMQGGVGEFNKILARVGVGQNSQLEGGASYETNSKAVAELEDEQAVRMKQAEQEWENRRMALLAGNIGKEIMDAQIGIYNARQELEFERLKKGESASSAVRLVTKGEELMDFALQFFVPIIKTLNNALGWILTGLRIVFKITDDPLTNTQKLDIEKSQINLLLRNGQILPSEAQRRLTIIENQLTGHGLTPKADDPVVFF
jgi:hypothetical protein